MAHDTYQVYFDGKKNGKPGCQGVAAGRLEGEGASLLRTRILLLSCYNPTLLSSPLRFDPLVGFVLFWSIAIIVAVADDIVGGIIGSYC